MRIRLRYFPLVLKKYRVKAGKKVEDILNHVRVVRTTYYSWEKGKMLPEPERLDLLINFFAKHLPEIPEEKIREDLVEAYQKDQELRKKELYQQVSAAEISEESEPERPEEKPVGSLILEDMKNKNVTMETLSEKTGIDMVRLAKILTNFDVPTTEELTKIAEVLEVPRERYLFQVDEEVITIVAKNPRLRKILKEFSFLNEKNKDFLLRIMEVFLEFEKREREEKKS